MSRQRIIIDCDPGHDDALAVLCAAKYADVLAITTVSGNVDLERTTRNARLAAEIAGLRVPIHAGADRPLQQEAIHAEYVHGKSGLDGPELWDPVATLTSEDAVQYLVDAFTFDTDIWLVATGPLTNVALALREDSTITERARGLSIMGGSVGPGNITAAAEFNFYADPEAAAEVLDAPWAKVRMCGLDLTHQVNATDAWVDELSGETTRSAEFCVELLRYYLDVMEELGQGRRGPLHDPCAVLAVTHPELFDFRPRRTDVELDGTLTRGMSLTDERPEASPADANVDVAFGVDSYIALELIGDAIIDPIPPGG